MRAWLIGAVLATGCIDAHLTLCGDGTACPAGLVCDHAHQSCAAPDQLTACDGVADGTACQTSELSGTCFDGVCLTPGCGNKVVEPGEQCDDGNRAGGDGCSNDCRSDERCGNGVADLGLGEACDDGNLVSHDGCDSRCELETVQWRMFPVSLTGGATNAAAFDAAHGHLVVPAQRTVWLWDHAAWSVSPVLAPKVDSWSAATYDGDRQHVIAFALRDGAVVVLDWDGARWLELSPTGIAPDGKVALAIYDPVQRAVMWLTSDSFGYLTVTGGASWTSATLLPFQVGSGTHAAFDGHRMTTVVVDVSGGGTWEYDGTAWTRSPGTPPGSGGHALVYDPDRAQLLALGGIGVDASGTSPDVRTWNGSDWGDAGASIPTRASPTVWYDPAYHSIGVFGGVDGQSRPLNDLVDLAGTTVTAHAIVMPPGVGALAYDASHDRIVANDTGATYTWDGTWHALAGTPPPPDAKLAFDPLRGTIVAFDTHALTVLQLDTTWRVIANGFSANAASFDYTRRGIVAISTIGAYLVDENAAISAIAPAPPDLPLAAAYDLDGARVAVLGLNGLSDLVNAQWQRSLAPSGEYGLVAALQTASLLLVPEGAVDETRAIWERTAGSFRQVDTMPFASTVTAAVERSRGRLDILLADGPSHVLLERQLASALPDETCAPADDADGDGAAGCADADCWATCWPACPLATSCP